MRHLDVLMYTSAGYGQTMLHNKFHLVRLPDLHPDPGPGWSQVRYDHVEQFDTSTRDRKGATQRRLRDVKHTAAEM